MSTKKILYLLCLISIFMSSFAYAQSTSVRIDKINYCRAPWPICNDTLQDDYDWWENLDVPDQIQKQTYIGSYNRPPKQDVEHLVFLAGGQRFERIRLGPIKIGGGQWNLITGQPNFGNIDKQDSHRWFDINTRSIAFQMLQRDIYSTDDTFIGLAFDARFNWAFSRGNKRNIVNAYYYWLKSKANMSKVKSIYLGGHSRGGALVLELAKKFKQHHPDIALIAHAFDPVPNRKKGELNAYNDYIDNPIAGFPRRTALLDNEGNWSWKSNFNALFPNKRRLAIYNFLSGGKVIGLAQEVRSVTHETGYDEITDLGWYFQRWFDLSNENADGHNDIARRDRIVNIALNHLEERLDFFLNNIATEATVNAHLGVCHPHSSLEECAIIQGVNDENLDSRINLRHSWTNVLDLPQSMTLKWPHPIKARGIAIVTASSSPLQSYRVEYKDGRSWRRLYSATNNNNRTWLERSFNEIETKEIRIVMTNGADNNPNKVFINEVLVSGTLAPTARCSFRVKRRSPRNTMPPGKDLLLSHNAEGTWSYSTIKRNTWHLITVDNNTSQIQTDTQVGRNVDMFYYVGNKDITYYATLIVEDMQGNKDRTFCNIRFKPGRSPSFCHNEDRCAIPPADFLPL